MIILKVNIYAENQHTFKHTICNDQNEGQTSAHMKGSGCSQSAQIHIDIKKVTDVYMGEPSRHTMGDVG